MHSDLELITCTICLKCWEPLNVFHSFYLQIERAHKLLKERTIGIKNVETTISITEVLIQLEDQLENMIDESEPSEDPYKSEYKRSRPRKNIKVEKSKRVQSHAKVNEDHLPPAKRRRGRPPKNKQTSLQQPNDLANGTSIECPLKEKSVSPIKEEDDQCDSVNENLKISKNPTSQTARMQQHDEFIAANFKLTCCLCKCSLLNFNVLYKHFRSAHKLKGYAICCGTKFRTRGLLVDHLHLHKDENYFKCTICDKVMLNRKGLNLHKKIHTQRERIFKCEICSKSFFNRIIYVSHKLVHVPDEEKIEQCTDCEKTFATKYLLRRHIRSVHLKVDAKVCEICGKTVRGREPFRLHQNIHKEVKQRLIKCKVCPALYSNEHSLKYHTKMMHREENLKPQECSICSKVSPNLMAHRRHMAQHRLLRKHVCTLCGKGFKKNATLKEHMTTHTGEILYTCPHCPKTFSARANMHSHRKNMHRKEWEEARIERNKLRQILLSDGEVNNSNKMLGDINNEAIL